MQQRLQLCNKAIRIPHARIPPAAAKQEVNLSLRGSCTLYLFVLQVDILTLLPRSCTDQEANEAWPRDRSEFTSVVDELACNVLPDTDCRFMFYTTVNGTFSSKRLVFAFRNEALPMTC